MIEEINKQLTNLKNDIQELICLIDDNTHSEEYKLKIIKERLNNIIH
jgi:hypothetical protein